MRADDLGAVVRLYNRAVAAIPCNWPLTEAEFAEALLGNGTLSGPGRRLDPQTVYVAGTAGDAWRRPPRASATTCCTATRSTPARRRRHAPRGIG